jgi:hypothetical protein
LDQASEGKEAQLVTLAMIAGTLKTLNGISFLLDSRPELYKSVYSFVNNGCTSLLLLTVSILLGMDSNDPKALTIILLCAAIANRIVDMVQNAYAAPGKVNEKLYKSSIDRTDLIDIAKITNPRAIVVATLLVVGTVLSAVGAVKNCSDVFSASDANCDSQEDVTIMLSYFSIMCVHAGLALVAFVVQFVAPEKSSISMLALSTVEIPRVLVSTTIIVLGGLVLGTPNTILSMSYVVYALADGFGMSLM